MNGANNRTFAPAPIRTPITDASGCVSAPWILFFNSLWHRFGGNTITQDDLESYVATIQRPTKPFEMPDIDIPDATNLGGVQNQIDDLNARIDNSTITSRVALLESKLEDLTAQINSSVTSSLDPTAVHKIGTETITGLKTFTQQIVVTMGTITTSQPWANVTQTWNAGGVTFTGMALDITDTASAAGSLLADWKVGGASKFSVSKSGITSCLCYTATGFSATANTFGTGGTDGTSIVMGTGSANDFCLRTVGGSYVFQVPTGTTNMKIVSDIGFYNFTPVARQNVSGSRGGNAALASLITALATSGLISDSSTA